jgi:predicted Zn-dependent peptidase
MNKNESAYLFSQLGTVNQALNLSYAEWLEDPDLIYTELDHYTQLTREDIHRVLNQYINPQQGNYLYLSNH